MKAPKVRDGGNLYMPQDSRLVFYSLIVPNDRRREFTWQFETSVQTLRTYNASIPVALFIYDRLPPEIETICRRHQVLVQFQGRYRDRLAALAPRGAAALALYPVLHKNLNFPELERAGVTQALCCDLDTIFFGDVAELFEKYDTADVVAREEVHSSRSIHGADQSFIDEALMRRVGAQFGRAFVPPFNLGFVLYNHGAVGRLAALAGTFADDTWRLLCGLLRHPACGDGGGTFANFPWMPAVERLATQSDLDRALPFPSGNPWIAEEVALWLALGTVEGLTTADFSPGDVAQNGEVLGTDVFRPPWLACHYYSHNLRRIAEWLQPLAQART